MEYFAWWDQVLDSKLEFIKNKIIKNEILVNLDLSFNDVNNLNENQIKDLRLIFHDKLSHIYWDQSNSFNKLFQDDRNTVILFKETLQNLSSKLP